MALMRLIIRLILPLLLLTVIALTGLRIAAYLRESQDVTHLPSEMRMLRHPDGDIAMMELGPLNTRDNPEAVLLIHGSVGYSLTWWGTANALAQESYAPIAIDLPPMGFSQREVDGDYGRAATAERILRVVEQLEVRPHLVAHSFGAGAAVEAVMRAPDSFASLTIIAGALPLDPPADAALPIVLRPVWLREVLVSATVTNPLATGALLQLFLHRDEAATPDVLRTLRRPSQQDGATEALARWLPNLLVAPVGLRSTLPEAYAALDLPVALIWGAEDTTTPLAEGENLQALIPGATLTVLPGVGHIPMIEDPEAFDAALIAALAELQ